MNMNGVAIAGYGVFSEIYPENTPDSEKVAYFTRALLTSGSRPADPNFSFLCAMNFAYS
jgi:hypothetical protein